MEIDLKFRKKTCCSVELFWEIKNLENNIENVDYLLEQKEGSQNLFGTGFNTIYEGNNKSFEIENLSPNKLYTFKLTSKRFGQLLGNKTLEITTLWAPSCLISKKSLNIANGKLENIQNEDNLTEYMKNIINNCGNFLYEENNESSIEANFEGIIIKVTSNKYEEKDIYYISFDIADDYIDEFIKKYNENNKINVNFPCYFIFPKLPTYFIFDLFKKGLVILTGKDLEEILQILLHYQF